MKFNSWFLVPLAIFTSCSTQVATDEPVSEGIQYPETRKGNDSDIYFGTTVHDPYRWLEDENSAETNDWVNAQNAITNAYLNNIPFRADLKKRLTEVWNYQKFSAPFREEGNFFQFRNNGIQNQSVLYVMKDAKDEGTVMLDPNRFSAEGTTALTDFSVSGNGSMAVYGTSKAGSDWKEFRVIDIQSKKELSDRIRWVKFSGVAWKGNGFYYSRFELPDTTKALTSTNKNSRVYYHRTGTSQDKDSVVFEDPANPNRNFYTQVSDDEKYLFIYESETTSGNSLLMQDISVPGKPVVRMTSGFDFDYHVVDHIKNKIYIHTNYNAPRYRLMVADPANPSRENWQEVIPEQAEVMEEVYRIDGMLAVKTMKDVSNRIYLYTLDGKLVQEVPLPGLGVVNSFNSKDKDTVAYFTFSTFTAPTAIYKYSVKTNTVSLLRAPEVNLQTADLQTEQVFYRSKDGTRIPMFITYKKGIKKDGNNPLLLYGYGGFNISITPGFKPDIGVFLENGGIYAVANIRGGGEYGKDWHDAGILLKKQNVFDDFIGAAEYLISEGYTSGEKLAITGRSNGGLLIGAVMTQRPDLFAVAVPQVGVLDMLRYHEFTIGRAWAADYGLSEDQSQFKNLLAYSPLHNARPAAYPATLIMTGDHDDRVVPAHSYKFAATLQQAQKGPEPVLIRIDRNAGHGAGKPVSMQIEEAADMWSFIFRELGMEFGAKERAEN